MRGANYVSAMLVRRGKNCRPCPMEAARSCCNGSELVHRSGSAQVCLADMLLGKRRACVAFATTQCACTNLFF